MTASSDEVICPVCGSDCVQPARARVLDHLVRLVGARPYWCADCGERFRSSAEFHPEAAQEVGSSESVEAMCPNCDVRTEIQLTRGEREMADHNGWVVSCPQCRALFAFIRPGESQAAGR